MLRRTALPQIAGVKVYSIDLFDTANATGRQSQQPSDVHVLRLLCIWAHVGRRVAQQGVQHHAVLWAPCIHHNSSLNLNKFECFDIFGRKNQHQKLRSHAESGQHAEQPAVTASRANAHARVLHTPAAFFAQTLLLLAVTAMNAAGLVPVCYFSTQFENWRPDSASFPASALGSNISGWAGERYVDTRTAEIRNIMTAVSRNNTLTCQNVRQEHALCVSCC